MNRRFLKFLNTFLLATILSLTIASGLNKSFSEGLTSENGDSSSQNYDAAYDFDVYYGHFRSMHTLHVSVPPSLYEYYERKSHFVTSDGDYVKFATPSVFAIVAESIKEATSEAPYSDEQFANAVLTVVRQIPYARSAAKYPVEAIVKNAGDCDVLSLLAASIMKAGGLDVVLLHYKSLNPSHMNVGVYLPYKPVYRSWWLAPTGFEYDNKTYWIAECTSQGNWKVGDEPSLLADTKPRVIPLRSVESSPSQVSSRLDSQLALSAISITFSLDNSSFESEERSLSITGEVYPALNGKNVTMYVGRERLAYETHKTITDENGKYSFTWNFTQAGKYTVTTSLCGTPDFAGSDSENLTVLAGVYEPIFEEYYADSELQDPMARANSAPFVNLAGQGPKYVLKSNVSGTGLLLSGEFMIINENDTGTPTIELTIPQVERTIYFPRTRQVMRVVVREEQVINKSVENDQLGFILRQDGEENYSASIGVLGDQQISQISTILQESNPAYMNASDYATRNKWYKVEATISKNETDAKLYEMNNTLLETIAAPQSSKIDEMGILMSYPPNSILAFKNLKISTLDEPVTPLPSEEEKNERNESEWLKPYIVSAVLLAIGSVAIGYARRRKGSRTKQNQRAQLE